MTQKIRIFLADDHAVLRTGLKMFINSQPDMICVGEAGDGASTLALARSLRPEVLLLDLSMPGLGGLDALPEIRRQLFRLAHLGQEPMQIIQKTAAVETIPAMAFDSAAIGFLNISVIIENQVGFKCPACGFHLMTDFLHRNFPLHKLDQTLAERRHGSMQVDPNRPLRRFHHFSDIGYRKPLMIAQQKRRALVLGH